MKCVVSSLFLTFGLLSQTSESFPAGAGGCDGGGPAVGGSHIDGSRLTQNGTLAQGLTALFINDEEIFPDTPVDLTAGEDIAWEIVSNFNPPPGCPEIPLRGVLFRLEAPTGIDLSAAISGTGSLLQPAAVCDAATGNVVGITHTDNSDKESVAGTLRLDENVNGVIFDITVVYTVTEFTAVPGTGNVSFFAYDSFTANFIGMSTSAPTEGLTTSAPTEVLTTLAPTDALNTLSPSDVLTTLAPTDALNTLSPSDVLTTLAPTDALTTLAPTDVLTTLAPTDVLTTSAPTEALNTSAPTDGLNTFDPTGLGETSFPTNMPTMSPVGQPSSSTPATLAPQSAAPIDTSSTITIVVPSPPVTSPVSRPGETVERPPTPMFEIVLPPSDAPLSVAPVSTPLPTLINDDETVESESASSGSKSESSSSESESDSKSGSSESNSGSDKNDKRGKKTASPTPSPTASPTKGKKGMKRTLLRKQEHAQYI